MKVTESLLKSKDLVSQSDSNYLIEHLGAEDEKLYLQLLERYVTSKQALERYKWLYKNNPQGHAHTWLARERVGEEIVGFTSIYPRKFLVEGIVACGGIGFDAFVRPDHRRKGIALALHQASLRAMNRKEVPFRFMCGPPTRANLEALKKAGSQVIGTLRYVSIPFTMSGLMTMLHCPKNYSEKVANFGTAVDRLLKKLCKVLNNNASNISVRVVESVDERFDQLWEEIAANFHIIGLRDRQYLEWRYIENPVCTQKLVSMEYKGSLLGWAVLEFSSKGCLLIDYLLPLEGKLAQETLSALVNFVAAQNTPRITLRFNLKGLYASLFHGHGFLPGWTAEYFQTLCSDKVLEPLLLKQNYWHFTNGDLNPEASPWSINTAPDNLFIDPSHIGPISNFTSDNVQRI